MKKLALKLLIGCNIVLIVLVGVNALIPFSAFVDVKTVRYHDICAGSDTQLVTALRDVHFTDTYPAEVTGELFRYDGVAKLETIIKRKIEFAYQISAEPVTYEIKWSEPITTPGLYGASDSVTISPLLIDKSAYFTEEDQKFNVIECDPN